MSCVWHLQTGLINAPSPRVDPASATLSELRLKLCAPRVPLSAQDICPSPHESPPSLGQQRITALDDPAATAAPALAPLGSTLPFEQGFDSTQSDAAFEFPIEVERMVSDLCSSSTAQEGSSTYSPLPLSLGFGGLGGLGAGYGGVPSADLPPAVATAPPAAPKQRSPFSLLQPLQMPQAAPVAQAVQGRASGALTPLSHMVSGGSPYNVSAGLGFGEPCAAPAASLPPPMNGVPCSPCFSDAPLLGRDSVRAFDPGRCDVPHAAAAAAAPMAGVVPDTGLSFRELVVKGCVELENILRVHQQHSYIGDLLTFCHSIRQSAESAAAAAEFDAPSDETRALIIAFFRLVSCWLGLFPCQQELYAFREWQLASRKVIVAILKRVPALRRGLDGNHEQRGWRAAGAAQQGTHPPRTAWSKGAARGSKNPAKGNKPAHQDWPPGAAGTTAMGPRGSCSSSSSSPRWRPDAALADVHEEGPDGSRTTASSRVGLPPSVRDKWRLAVEGDAVGAEGQGGTPRVHPGLGGGLGGLGHGAAVPAPPGPGRSTSSTGKGKRWPSGPGPDSMAKPCSSRPAPRLPAAGGFEPDDDLHDGAYMKPGCYDVPVRRTAPSAATSATAAPGPMLPTTTALSETTWQAALASAETLCRSLQSRDEAEKAPMLHAPQAELANAAVASPAKAGSRVPLVWLPLSLALEDAEQSVVVVPPSLPTTVSVDITTSATATATLESQTKEASEEGNSPGQQGGRRRAGGGRAGRTHLSPATARKARAILDTLWGLQGQADEFEGLQQLSPGDGQDRSECWSCLGSISLKLKNQAYETLEQFEEDFRAVLFSHTDGIGEATKVSAKVSAQRAEALLAFDALVVGRAAVREASAALSAPSAPSTADEAVQDADEGSSTAATEVVSTAASTATSPPQDSAPAEDATRDPGLDKAREE